MRPLDLHSERYSATGNLEAHGARNQLGRPRLDQLTVLVREAFQNSWDARIGPTGVVCGIDVWTASPDQARVLRESVFAQAPPKLPFPDLWARAVVLLAVTDRGTQGLGGPSRADVIPEPGEPTDFVDLLRNLGQPPDKPLGGGTFGYGKAALYAPSAVNSILVYTRGRVAGRLKSRLIATCLGTGFTVHDGPSRGRYTGRHWWGRVEDGIAEPLVDEDADVFARMLGLEVFQPDETGTTILIVGFEPGAERDLAAAVRHLRSAILWNFWPKMVGTGDARAPMQFRVTLEGSEFEVPDPDATPPLNLFAQALRRARTRKPLADLESIVVELTSASPRRSLGWLALVKGLRVSRPADLLSDASVGGVEARNTSHVACMRSAELVVKYLAQPPLEIDILEYAGVFVASETEDVDRAFAQSEPPTHDDWVPGNLRSRSQGRLVRAGLRGVADTATAMAQPASGRRDETSHAPLGQLSAVLGNILVGLEGPGGEAAPLQRERTRAEPTIEDEPDLEVDEPHGEPGTTEDVHAPVPDSAASADPAGGSPDVPRRPPGRPSVKLSQPRLAVEDEDVGVLQVDVDVRHGVRTRGTRLRVNATVILDGGEAEREPPSGALVPTPWRWRGPTRVVERPGDTLELGENDQGRWTLSVRLIDDAEVRVAVVGEALT